MKCVMGWKGAALCLLLLPGLAAADAAPNLVQNPGFEQLDAAGKPDAWNGWNDAWQVDSSVFFSGTHSVRWHNTDPARYVLLTQSIPAQPGRRYRLSCRIKTEDVRGEDSGATVCLEWADAKGQYLGGFYPSGFKGTNDWRLLSEESTRIPREASRVTVTVYVRSGMTGTAWFDDLKVEPVPDPPYSGTIVVPGYRGAMIGKSAPPVLVHGLLGQGPKNALSDVTLTAVIAPKKGGKPLVRRVMSAPSSPGVEMSLPTSALPDGRYTVRLTVSRKGRSKPLAVQTASLVRSQRAPATRMSIRADGVTLLNGKPFFPLGVYEASPPSSASSRERLKTLASAGFNSVMNYSINDGSVKQIRSYLDAAQASGLKVIYSVKDLYPGLSTAITRVGPWTGEKAVLQGVVSTFRDHPALLAWYINDELPLSRHAEMLRHYRLVRDQDPDHPIWSVLYQVEELNGYADTTDVIGVDPYPLPGRPLTMVSGWTDRAIATGLPAWVVPQIFDPRVYNPGEPSTPPTFDQMRCMTWLALAHGANGLVYYSYFDLLRGPEPARRWGDVKRLAAEVKQAMPWLVAGERGQVRVENGVHLQTWRNGTRTLVVAVNPENRSSDVSIALPAGAASVTPLFGSAPASAQHGTLSFKLAPLEVRAYRLGP